MVFEVFLRGLVELAPFVRIIAAYLGPGAIDAASTVGRKMLATAANQQIPTTPVLINLHTVVGNLPKQMFEVSLGSRG
jgi:hypothetical protein